MAVVVDDVDRAGVYARSPQGRRVQPAATNRHSHISTSRWCVGGLAVKQDAYDRSRDSPAQVRSSTGSATWASVEQFRLVFTEQSPQSIGPLRVRRVKRIDQAANVRWHDDQVGRGPWSWIPECVGHPRGYDDARARGSRSIVAIKPEHEGP
jgi:hypothetical protein